MIAPDAGSICSATVKLLLGANAGFDQNAFDGLALRARLRGHEFLAKQFAGRGLGRLGRIHFADAAGGQSLAGKDLRLDENRVHVEPRGRRFRFVHGHRNRARRSRDRVLRQ